MMFTQQTNDLLPPSTFEEFLKKERLDYQNEDWAFFQDLVSLPLFSDWPMVGNNEAIFEIGNLLDDVISTDEIIGSFKSDCSITTDVLDALDTRIGDLQRRLELYADVIMTGEGSEQDQREQRQPRYSEPRRVAEPDSTKTPKRESKDRGASAQMRALILGSKTRSVELTSYPGFKPGELTDLPHGVEAHQLLDRVTRAQEFNTGFSRFWKRLFQSDASVAILQDTFWWFFLEKYQEGSSADQKRIFNRICDSFVALFNNVNAEIKDKFFAVYSDCLAQALFAAYWEAFLDSHEAFNADFKQEITSLCSEWIAGVKAQPESYSHWNVQKLQPKGMNRELKEDSDKVVLMKDGKVNTQADFSLSFDLTDTQGMDGLDPANHKDENVILETANTYRIPPSLPKESHPIGPGPEFERVQFNLSGRSPLVAHYLYMRGLSGSETVGRSVRRTEVSNLQSPAPTYKDVIRETKKISKAVQHKYHEISDILSRELAAIERQRVQHNREIESLKKQLQHHSTDMKVMSEKILDAREREGNTVRIRVREYDESGRRDETKSPSSSSDED